MLLASILLAKKSIVFVDKIGNVGMLEVVVTSTVLLKTARDVSVDKTARDVSVDSCSSSSSLELTTPMMSSAKFNSWFFSILI